MSDMNYYGAYSNVPGFGMMWQPYFTGVGWNPFMDGAWSWYPGFGYMFASAYPWGWMPYRYGSWMSVPGMGWMEQLAHHTALHRHLADQFPSPGCTCSGHCQDRSGREGWSRFCRAPVAPRGERRFGRHGDSARFAWKSEPHQPSGGQIRIR